MTENIYEKLEKNINLVRNIWNPFDRNHEKILGCTTVNDCMSPIGDVLVCPYVHIKLEIFFNNHKRNCRLWF